MVDIFIPSYHRPTNLMTCRYFKKLGYDMSKLTVFIDNETDDIAEYTHIHLPKSDVELDLTMQTPRLLDAVTKRVKQAKRRMNNRENPDILYVMLTSIVKKDGKDFDSITGEMWLRDLPLSDANVIIKAIDRLNSSFGLDLSVYHTCENCGEEIIVPFRVNETFFRPPVF